MQKAKKQLLYALIALVIGIMAWGFQPLIENILGGGGGAGGSLPAGSGTGTANPGVCIDENGNETVCN